MGFNPKGTVSLHNKVYAFGWAVLDTMPDTTAAMTGYVYDPVTGVYTESLPGLPLEGIVRLDGEDVVVREAADEIYQVAGTWDWAGGSRYHKLFVSPQGTGEVGPAVVPAGGLRMSTLFRNGGLIHYEIDQPCRATLTVYDQSGRVIRTLASGQMQAGSYAAAWDGRDEYGRLAGSGVYFCRLQAGQEGLSRKLVLTE
jgi:hypothetical protein